ncbi:MAG TPA: SRPBCC domain-containing protein [Saprospiraceae bacterium]|nr:SRPBCC domain-containing protein [Saprospiraceae bacterium]HMQ85922.1 SRPBCC domain-containing protein [Saprospiraceae bacterium]
MRSISTEIIIEASASKVWQVLMDHQSYPKWNPFIRSISGAPEVGKTISAHIQPEGQKAMHFQPLVLVHEPEKEFRWKGKLFISGLFDGEHFFRLEQMGADKTRFVHVENFTGLLVPPLLAMIGDSTRQGFEAMNRALKEQAECR